MNYYCAVTEPSLYGHIWSICAAVSGRSRGGSTSGLGLVGSSAHSVGALELMRPGQAGAERGAARAAPVCVSSA